MTGAEGVDLLRDVDNFDCNDPAGCGSAPDDVLDGGPGVDEIAYQGAAGVDVDLVGGTATGAGADTIAGFENVTGTELSDRLFGDDGPNVLYSGGGADLLGGRGGDDTLTDTYNDFTGFDGDEFHGHGGDDVLQSASGTSQLFGEEGNDVILTGSGPDEAYGGAGDDTIRGSGDDDVVEGGEGSDTIDFATTSLGVTIDLTAGTGSKTIGSFDTPHGTDTYVSVENAVGSTEEDTLVGNDAANVLGGGAGNDSIDGRGGDDRVDGGEGTDTCTNAEQTTGCET